MRRILAVLCGLAFIFWLPAGNAPASDLNAAGKRVAEEHCSRCHVVGEANRMGGIGSTPSFALLRRMRDWEERYSSFFARNPHPSVITVNGLSEARTLPPNAVPITLTEQQVDALMIYVRNMKVE
ncbi:cytochrome c [Hwanghaeella grinnelliae]|uniref:Cytochrome c n=1 Tax=Hwanghaeella grinnelliae TaxID=2500179 RepID=A0A437QHQ9_9PROT|nr:cytochrome c [Hwanghaeella grinnelliae]RVU34087.1 cytochrome c [Hwanghaeella grinnelliae]